MIFKKGEFLAEEVLKMIIALMVVGFLGYFLVSLYLSSQDSNDKELAIATLDNLILEIDNKKISYDVLNPKDWFLIVWPANYDQGFFSGMSEVPESPQVCKNVGWTSCVCFCPEMNPDDCDETGYCVNNEKGISIKGDFIEVEAVPLKLNLDYSVGVKIIK